MAIIQGQFFFLINPGRINNSEARVPQLRYFLKSYHSYCVKKSMYKQQRNVSCFVVVFFFNFSYKQPFLMLLNRDVNDAAQTKHHRKETHILLSPYSNLETFPQSLLQCVSKIDPSLTLALVIFRYFSSLHRMERYIK